MKLGSHLNFLGAIGTASILLWGLSQSKAKPEYPPAHIQVRTAPKPTQGVAIDLAPTPQTAPVATARHLVKDTTITNLRKPHEYAAIEPKESVYQLASKDIGDGRDSQAEVKTTPIVPDTAATAGPEPIKQIRRLTSDVTIKDLCKLRNYAVIEPKEPAYQLASKENDDTLTSPAEVKVTPFIRDVMNRVRPKVIAGTIKVEGKEYEFGSGGHGQSIPYGDYLITPGAVGSWGSRHGAIGVANGTIPDPKLHRDRDGIELHAATNDKLETDGCVSIRKDQWPEFKKQVLTMVKDSKGVYLHVSDQGASVSTNPLEFIGETISEPTFRDALSMIEAQPAKIQSDRPAIRHSEKARVRGERHASLYGSCGRGCRRRRAGSARMRS